MKNESIQKKIVNICNQENITYTEKGIKTLIHSSWGDIRQAINNLECISLTYKKITKDTESLDQFLNIAPIIINDFNLIDKYLLKCILSDPPEAFLLKFKFTI